MMQRNAIQFTKAAQLTHSHLDKLVANINTFDSDYLIEQYDPRLSRVTAMIVQSKCAAAQLSERPLGSPAANQSSAHTIFSLWDYNKNI